MEGLNHLITICVSKSFSVNERTALGVTDCMQTDIFKVHHKKKILELEVLYNLKNSI